MESTRCFYFNQSRTSLYPLNSLLIIT